MKIIGSKKNKWQYTLGRVLVFCLSCTVVLAAASRLTQGMPKQWSQHLLVLIAAGVTFGLTILFVRWEGLELKDVGVIPRKKSTTRFFGGFLLGLILAILQAVLLLSFAPVKLLFYSKLNFAYILSGLLLYLLIALREELAFRAYPLRSLNYKLGTFYAQLIIAIIFIAEHMIGGMTWTEAILGAGTGAILFGLAALKTKGIALPMGIHAAWNFTQWCAGFKNEPGIWQTVIEKGNETKVEQIGLICYLTVMWAAILIIYYYPDKKKSENLLHSSS
jgi:membrane protease YdiL (CAAX protease family)